mmetsp:Transcript_23932/g.76999  ORF Transcript_23932/g.76999 Transcript_23932/m.76999 type:complete len:222 (-) Transcript_23932:268-933(-)
MGGRPTRRLLLLALLSSSSFSLGRLFLDASASDSEEACLSHDDFDDDDEVRHEALEEASSYLEAHSKWSLGPEEVFAFEVSQGGKKASTFGHATVRGAASLVRHWQAHRERPGLFFDLGSGNGHVVLYAAIVDNASTFVGIEMAPTRVRVAQEARDHLHASYPELGLERRVTFFEGDMLDADLRRADAVFVSSLALGPTLRNSLAAKLRRECHHNGTVRST